MFGIVFSVLCPLVPGLLFPLFYVLTLPLDFSRDSLLGVYGYGIGHIIRTATTTRPAFKFEKFEKCLRPGVGRTLRNVYSSPSSDSSLAPAAAMSIVPRRTNAVSTVAMGVVNRGVSLHLEAVHQARAFAVHVTGFARQMFA